ncbi:MULTISPECIES: SLAP domain-containing protein [Virgibacillus]|uniref:SLAP domain-containing protein n=1 Tax=Virgibacillus TaxID=84406 RepID=UPI000388332D|nr:MULTISPECIES: SLAP domain-containing protein [Virgibacillus]EQB38492.1 hypothetical protein M948_07870 [Virgibacillus sp. CM-4]MYL41198.1 SLAP domain-containing protein [Virgibacillus massiliensis]
MQRLIFEQAWAKTIDPNDRRTIEQVFAEANASETNQSFVPLQQARNHRGDLLIMVIIQNYTSEQWTLDPITLTYYENENCVATHTFSDPRLILDAKCSMPWTFIFPKTVIQQEPNFINGYLKA